MIYVSFEKLAAGNIATKALLKKAEEGEEQNWNTVLHNIYVLMIFWIVKHQSSRQNSLVGILMLC